MQLSILLPTHNRSDVLPFAIDSVLSQTFGDFELLIVGDGCTDGTADVVQKFASLDSRIRWFDLPKGAGFGYDNRNIALREARGELIAYMSHDDINAPEHYANLVSLMVDPAVQLGHTSAVWVAGNGDMVPTAFHLEDSLLRNGMIEQGWNRLPASCFIHRRQAFEDVGMWNAELKRCGDLDLWSRIMTHYGPQSVRSLPVFTTFHFRAIWRTQESVSPDNEQPWLRLHAAPGRMGSSMKLSVPAGQSEQEALAILLKNDSTAVSKISTACVHALMSHAWDLDASGHVQRGRVSELEHLHASAAKKLEKSQARVAELTSQRDSLKQDKEKFKQQANDLGKKAAKFQKGSWWKWWK